MGSNEEPPANPETPWEFLPDDDLRSSAPRSAEDEAMHVIGLGADPDDDDGDDVVVHYLEDEHPEIPDPTQPVDDDEHTPQVQELLIRQHYMPADDKNR